MHNIEQADWAWHEYLPNDKCHSKSRCHSVYTSCNPFKFFVFFSFSSWHSIISNAWQKNYSYGPYENKNGKLQNVAIVFHRIGNMDTLDKLFKKGISTLIYTEIWPQELFFVT